MVSERLNLWTWLAVPLCALVVAACGDDGSGGDDETCDDAECVTPPGATCSGDVLVEYAAVGACGLDDACVYETTSTPCAAGCSDGACVDAEPCEGVTCDEPPANACDGDTLVTFEAAGTCDDATGDCSYAMTETDCTETDQQCRAGACVDVGSVCDDVVCDTPPRAQCNEGGELVVYDADGVCNPDSGECEYTETTVICTDGLVCLDGACVDETDICLDVVCDSLDPICDGNEVITYAAGTCDPSTGECVYDSSAAACDDGFACFAGECIEDTGLCDDVVCDEPVTFCNDAGELATRTSACDPTRGVCEATETSSACGEGFTCSFGACVEDTGLCDGVTCEDAEPTCNADGDAVTGVGVCRPSTGDCDVDFTVTPCGDDQTCNAGVCVDNSDPCATVTCDDPAPSCDELGRVVTSTDGVCDSVDGTCSYTETTTECDDGFSCFDGACVEDAGLCDDVTCDPQPPTCATDTSILTFGAGSCDPETGTCEYAETVVDCGTDQICRDAECVDIAGLCDDVVCEPSPSSCLDSTTVLVWTAECNPDTGSCREDATPTPCPGGGGCVLGECVGGTLCDGVTCPARAPICDMDGNPVTFGPGTCNDGTGECEYSGTPGTCDGDTVCDAGVCVADLCADTTCDPLGPTCDIDGNRVTYGPGVCQPSTGACDYPPTATPCDVLDVCIDGVCVPDTPCAGVVCDPIAPFCNVDGDPVRTSNTCNPSTGLCEPLETIITCDPTETCVDGACEAVPGCETVTCDDPPDDGCNADGDAVRYSPFGLCDDETLLCDYPSIVTTCDGDTPLCSDGRCVAVPTAGAIVISEILYDAPGEDDEFEWFEIQNVSDFTVDLTGLVVVDSTDATETFTVDGIILSAGQVAVLAQSESAAPIVDVDWGGPAVFRLTNTADEIVLEYDGAEIDRVEYDEDAGWPEAVGRSLSVDPSLAGANDDPMSWCYGVEIYNDAGALGSPGSVNFDCDFLCFEVSCPPPAATCEDDGGTTVAVSYLGDGICNPGDGTCDYAPVTEITTCVDGVERCLNGACIPSDATIAPGELTITEFMANPDGTDTNFEWFEVRNTAGRELALAGLVVTSGAGESFTVTEDVVLPGESALVFAQSDFALPAEIPVVNWGGEAVLLLNNGGDEIVLEWDGTTVDSIAWDGDWPISSGVSAQFGGDLSADDNADVDNWCLSLTPYDDVSVGTPGRSNDGCGPIGPELAPGALLITEIMQNPDGDDTGQEWFEVLNTTSNPIPMAGVTFSDDGGESFTIPIDISYELPANTPIVFGTSEDAAGGFTAYVYSGMALGNGADELIITSAGAVVDRVAWDGGPNWPDPNGASMSLSANRLDPAQNDDPNNWCEGTDPYDGTNLGSPSASNGNCP